MNSLQIFWGLPLEPTPSVYAYSTLYPYTDNFLDNTEVNSEEKIKFNQRLSKVLNGENLTTTNFIEEKVFSLVGQIESQYCRDKFPEVFDSLRLIQEAQTESIKQDKDELIDNEVRSLISFIFKANTTDESDTSIMSLMKKVINSCTLVMIMDAAGRNPSLISHRLYKELESYSKVRLSFYKEFEDKIKSLIK